MKTDFLKRIRKRAKDQSSRIVLALDYTDEDPERLEAKSREIIEEVGESLAAVKMNYHLLLPLSLDSVKRIVETAHRRGLQAIADMKLNDISSTNLTAGSYLWKAGFDAVIANPIVGFEEGLAPLIEQAHSDGRGVILLVYMSHKGAEDGYGLTVLHESGRRFSLHEVFLERAVKWRTDGVVVGATKPGIISSTAELLGGSLPIFCPGVGVQGGSHMEAVRAGADFLIIGRTILYADDPAATTERIRRDVWAPHQET
ncbi:MAG: orotidine 5'-phosphate decarboxylase [Nitrososphaerales archaeon]